MTVYMKLSNILGNLTYQYNEVGWLLLMLLDKVIKKKKKGWAHEFNFPAQTPHKWPESFYTCLGILLPPVAAGPRLLKIKRISPCDWLNYRLDSQPHRVSTIKVRALTGEKMGSRMLPWGYVGKIWWIWKHTEPLNSDEPSLPVEEASPPPTGSGIGSGTWDFCNNA